MLRPQLVCLEEHLTEDGLQQEGKEGLGRRSPILPGTEGNADWALSHSTACGVRAPGQAVPSEMHSELCCPRAAPFGKAEPAAPGCQGALCS